MSSSTPPRRNTLDSWFSNTNSFEESERFHKLRAKLLGVLKKDKLTPKSMLPLVKNRVAYQISSITTVESGQLTETDFIIALMGPTGAGKSTFIQRASGRDDKISGVGHGLESYTSDVAALRITFSDGIGVVLVDTPGFDDTYLSDLKVLDIIAHWLRDASKYELCGILYLHRASDNRMSGAPLKNLTMFQKLCGRDYFGKVTLMTTMWPEKKGVGAGGEDEDEWELCLRREEELKNEYWKSMIERGSSTERFLGTQTSAWDIINRLVEKESERQWIRIQEELVNQGKKLIGTEAGQQLYGLTEQLVQRQSDLLRRTTEELKHTNDSTILLELLNELSELRKERERAMKDMRQLDSSVFGTLRRIFIPRRESVQPNGAGSKKSPTLQQHPLSEASIDTEAESGNKNPGTNKAGTARIQLND